MAQETTFAERLRAWRRAAGLTQQVVATALGVERSTYTYYETGKTKPDLNTLVRLAQMFGVSTDELVGKVTTPTAFRDGDALFEDASVARFSKLSLEEQVLVLQFRQLTEQQREALIQQAQENLSENAV